MTTAILLLAVPVMQQPRLLSAFALARRAWTLVFPHLARSRPEAVSVSMIPPLMHLSHLRRLGQVSKVQAILT
jgi:hypothetical protein